MIRRLLPCVGKYKKYAILAPLTIILEVILEVAIPFIMSKIIDIGIKNGDLAYITKMGIAMIVMALLSLLAGALSARYAAIASTGFAKGLRQKLFYKVQDFSFANIDKFSTASLVTRLTTDVTNAQNAFMMIIRMMVRSPIMLICAVCMAITINAELATVFLIAAPFLGAALIFVSTRAHPRFRAMLKKYDKMNSSIQENLIGIRVVKAFVRGEYENEKFRMSADEVRTMQLKAEKILILNSPIMQFTMYACMLAISWFGGNLIIAGNMETGQLMSFISYVSQILMSLMMISMSFVMMVMSRASLQRITEVLDELPDISDDAADNTAKVENGSIEFNNVSFGYAGKGATYVLDDITFKINAGETVGIIGATGSAKSSLVQLIPRLYDASEGEVLVGGRNVKEYTLEVLRDNVAMVLQKNVLFSGTILDNLKWGNPNASMDEIEEAAKAAQAHGFITSFPDGYDTNLGQGGVNLSGGQKQRLCIARALLKKPQIIILDDSTSAVDTATDKAIRAAFKEKLDGSTVIIIAQRIASVCDADKIIVLDDGRINAVGTHDELIETNEIYKDVYYSQQKGSDDDGRTA